MRFLGRSWASGISFDSGVVSMEWQAGSCKLFCSRIELSRFDVGFVNRNVERSFWFLAKNRDYGLLGMFLIL